MTIDWRAEMWPFAGLEEKRRGRTRLDFLSTRDRMWLAEMSPFEFERMAQTPVDNVNDAPTGEPVDEGKF